MDLLCLTRWFLLLPMVARSSIHEFALFLGTPMQVWGVQQKHFGVVANYGNRTQSIAESELVSRDHSAEILGGAQTSMADLVTSDCSPCGSRLDDVDPGMFEYVVALRADLRQCFTNSCHGKA